MKRLISLTIILLLWSNVSLPQAQSSQKDTSKKPEFKSLDIFPAISYSPETNLTLGAIGLTYFDLSKGKGGTSLSNLEFLGVYTLNNQIILETRWELFFNENKWRSRGELFFNRYPDRNYGLGNDAGALVAEANDEGTWDTLNYLNFDSDRIKFSPVILRQIAKYVHFGLQYDMEYLYQMKIIPEVYLLINRNSESIAEMPVQGLRSGVGIQLLYDNRIPLLNPLRGKMLEFNLLHYGAYFGSDYQFTSISADIRYYLNTVKNQTIAIRTLVSSQLTEHEVPMRALSRVGGHKFIRGYFKGTYQDYHMGAFELEYRLPFWPEGTDSKLWQVWKRLGIVTFLSGAQVFHELPDFRLNQFNLAVGGGVRILFNPESRVNLRFDYAIGLKKGSNGPSERQQGFYFYLGESF